MPARRASKTPAPLPERLDWFRLDRGKEKGRWFKPGQEVKIKGVRGDFTIKWIDSDGTLACWGGTGSRKSMRAFKPERVTTIKRDTRARREAMDQQ